MNKLQNLVCKIFKIEPVTTKYKINDPRECETILEGLSKSELSDEIEMLISSISGNEEINYGYEREITEIRHLPIRENGKRRLTKKVIVIEVEDKEWD